MGSLKNFWVTRILSLIVGVGGCFLLQTLVKSQNNAFTERLVVLAGIYVTLAVSLNLINGITGQFSIGHAAFYQVGAYSAGFITSTFAVRSGLPPLVWLPLMAIVGAIMAGVAGFVVGLPSLRLRGDYLAIVTLGFGEIIRIIVQNTKELGGSYGLNISPKTQSVAIVWILAVFCIALCRNLLKSAKGLPFLAVREDEIASSAMGVNVTQVKVLAFVIGSMFAGAAGAMLGLYEGFITPATFAMDVSFIILTMVVLGGTGSITGSAVAAAFLSYLPEWLRTLKNPGTTNALTLAASVVVATLISVVICVALMKRIQDHFYGKRIVRASLYAGTIVVGVLSAIGLSHPKLAIFIVGFLAIGLAVGLFKFVLPKTPKDHPRRVGIIVGSVLAVVLLPIAFTLLAGVLSKLSEKTIEVGQLRMVIFAVTLVTLMLLRPQGVFAHHEFSWDWLKTWLFGRNKAKKVSA